MAKYDLSSQRAIEDSARLAAAKARMEPNQGSYNAAWLHGYAAALKDCSKGLEPLQRLMDDVLNYLGEHKDSSELRRMFYEDMELSEEDVAFLGFDLQDEMDGEVADIPDVEYMVDFGNGFRIQKVFANQMPDGSYGDIYDFPSDVRKEHPGARIMIGYCVVDIGAGIVPHGCNDWNNTVAEAEADYEENVVPYLDEAFDEISDVEYVKDLGNGYKIQKVFGNRFPDGGHGDIYFYPDEVDQPDDGIVIGYCVVHVRDGLIPMVCNDWNDTVEEAIADYEEHVVPYLDRGIDEVLAPSGCVKDLGNGYQVQTVYANRLPDGSYGDIYNYYSDFEREHPGDTVMIGYCVVDTVDGMIPMVCKDWNDTVEEALADYEENVVPFEPMNMVVESWAEMQKKYPMDRKDMTEEEERAFVEDCFKLYEQEGFSPRYWSAFSDYAEKIGMPIEILGRVEADKSHDLSELPMWRARLADGRETEVFPDEVIPSEMKTNGCTWFKNMREFEYNGGFPAQFAGMLDCVNSMQEIADMFGCAVKNFDKYYLPQYFGRAVDEIIQEAEQGKSVIGTAAKVRDFEIG